MSERGILSGLKCCTRTSEKYDSSWERDYMRLLDDDPTVKRWERCRKLRIPYVNSAGKRSTYNPDFIIERADGVRELHEVKGGHPLWQPDTKLKLEAGERFCRKRGMTYKVITRRD